jgi:hypothetical protein
MRVGGVYVDGEVDALAALRTAQAAPSTAATARRSACERRTLDGLREPEQGTPVLSRPITCGQLRSAASRANVCAPIVPLARYLAAAALPRLRQAHAVTAVNLRPPHRRSCAASAQSVSRRMRRRSRRSRCEPPRELGRSARGQCQPRPVRCCARRFVPSAAWPRRSARTAAGTQSPRAAWRAWLLSAARACGHLGEGTGMCARACLQTERGNGAARRGGGPLPRVMRTTAYRCHRADERRARARAKRLELADQQRERALRLAGACAQRA